MEYDLQEYNDKVYMVIDYNDFDEEILVNASEKYEIYAEIDGDMVRVA